MKYRYTDEKRKHLHELDREDGIGYKPLIGTTTAINEVYPPPLAWWGSAMALEKLGFITEKKEPDETKRRALAEEGMNALVPILDADDALERYMKFLEGCYRNHDEYKKAKGKAGIDVHALIENYVKYCIKNNEGKPTNNPDITWEGIESFVSWADKDVARFLWSEAHTFSEKLWVGGITDFGFVHKNGMVIVADNKPSVYPKNFIQTAGYGIQIKENGLFNRDGEPLIAWPEEQGIMPIDGYCIFDYNKGEARYLSGDWVNRLEADFKHTIEMYGRRDLTGSNTI